MLNEVNVLHGPKPAVPLDESTAGQQLYNALLQHSHLPDAIINVHNNEKVSYKTLLEMSCRLAQSLQRCGYHQNSVISICSENSTNFICAMLASLYLGIITAPLNENYMESELCNALEISKPELIYCSKNSLKKILAIKRKYKFIKQIIVLDSKEDINNVESMTNFIIRNSDANLNVKKFKPLDFDANNQVAVIMCSSGTTGMPKGVMLTHRNMAVRFAQCKDPASSIETTSGATVLTFMPLFHSFGLLTTLGYLITGVHIAIMQRFDFELFLKSIQDYKVRSVILVPPVALLLAKSPVVDKYDLTSFKVVGCGAAPLGKDIVEAIKLRLKLEDVRQGYGLTEATLAITFTPPGDLQPGSSGTVVSFMSAKVVDIKNGNVLGPNERGEVWAKGGLIMKGYAGNAKSTNETIDQDGWLHTGDIGYYNENRHFYIVDRLKELIKYKSFQVPPAELESVLLAHPSIKDAGVVGIPDELSGELPCAFVVTQPGKKLTEKEVYGYVAGQLSSPKHLRGGVRFVEAIPKSITGKIIRKDLKKMLLQKNSKL